MTSAKALALLTVLGLAVLDASGFGPDGSLIVTMTSPTSGSAVGGTITIMDAPSLALTVRGVSSSTGEPAGEDTSRPYSIPWDRNRETTGRIP
jgi:hypothetical protein